MFNFKLHNLADCNPLLFYSMLIVIFIFSSCTKPYVTQSAADSSMIGLWTIVGSPDSTDPAQKEISKFMYNRFLHLGSDQKYTSNLTGQFDYGTYKRDSTRKGLLLFLSYNGSVYSYRLKLDVSNGKGIVYDSITLPGNLHSRVGISFNCSVINYKYNGLDDDPFSIQNNLWRIPAKSSENDSLLKVRISNHIDFWVTYLKTADQLEWTQLDMRNVTTPFHFYPTGITLTKVEKWPPGFLSLFYHKKEAERAFDLTTDAIYKVDFVKNENAYLQGIHLFKEIQNALLPRN